MQTVIYSLTEAGYNLANRLCEIVSDAEHKHLPRQFVQTVQQDFLAGKRGVFICATGIVIRAIAPLLKDKTTDPAVVVIDETGEYVVPLLSGHEGGAGQLARKIATALDAHYVSTSSTNYGSPILVLGIGCDRGCPADEIITLLDSSRARIALAAKTSNVQYSALASIDLKSNEAGLLTLSGDFSIPFKTYSASQLRSVENMLSHKSEIVFKEVGCYGVAEAAALLAAAEISGNQAELILTKQKNQRATLAVARSYL